jgi:AcrR family transcriptional regulator
MPEGGGGRCNRLADNRRMCPRPYQMQRRTASAQETRQRIVQATYELHAEKGIAATSMRDIAQRADVAVGSVYHHFPTYDDVIAACGAFTLEQTQPPTGADLDGLDTPAERLQALVRSVFDFYTRFEGMERIRAESDKFAQVGAFIAAESANRRSLLRQAIRPRKAGKAALALAMAMLDVAFYRNLRADGLTHDAALRATTGLLQRLLLDEAGDAGASPTPTAEPDVQPPRRARS